MRRPRKIPGSRQADHFPFGKAPSGWKCWDPLQEENLRLLFGVGIGLGCFWLQETGNPDSNGLRDDKTFSHITGTPGTGSFEEG